MLITCHGALSAGFDCKKAKSNVEKLICSSEQLSSLDDALNRQFQDTLEKAEDRRSLINEQKAWIKERDKCLDAKCLLKAYESRQDSLKSRLSCPIQELDLLGHWIANGEQEFEEMLFEIRGQERQFLSWRHHRPELPGFWKFQKCKIHIRHIDEPKLSFEYAVVKHSGRVLHLREIAEKEVATYTKAK
jgi:uncharacterized protein YecT (DUF1311 family)